MLKWWTVNKSIGLALENIIKCFDWNKRNVIQYPKQVHSSLHISDRGPTDDMDR